MSTLVAESKNTSELTRNGLYSVDNAGQLNATKKALPLSDLLFLMFVMGSAYVAYLSSI